MNLGEITISEILLTLAGIATSVILWLVGRKAYQVKKSKRNDQTAKKNNKVGGDKSGDDILTQGKNSPGKVEGDHIITHGKNSPGKVNGNYTINTNQREDKDD